MSQALIILSTNRISRYRDVNNILPWKRMNKNVSPTTKDNFICLFTYSNIFFNFCYHFMNFCNVLCKTSSSAPSSCKEHLQNHLRSVSALAPLYRCCCMKIYALILQSKYIITLHVFSIKYYLNVLMNAYCRQL